MVAHDERDRDGAVDGEGDRHWNGNGLLLLLYGVGVRVTVGVRVNWNRNGGRDWNCHRDWHMNFMWDHTLNDGCWRADVSVKGCTGQVLDLVVDVGEDLEEPRFAGGAGAVSHAIKKHVYSGKVPFLQLRFWLRCSRLLHKVLNTDLRERLMDRIFLCL